ncbi:MAG: hydroxymethylglutaryl-CoA synthase [Candidatus Aenigmatarchaeota archaeon]
MAKIVGIDDIATYVPRTFLELVPEEKSNGRYLETEFSKSRELQPSYLAEGLGTYQFGWPDGHQDPITMGVMSLKKLIENNDLELSEIGRVYVGTESSVDHSKPNAMYIVGAIERLKGRKGEMKNCTPVDVKFACAGGTVPVEFSAEWIETGKNNGKCAVVITTDVSSYNLFSPEEVTQGAGSVAMLIKENPRLLALENGMNVEIASTISRDERDFFRPADKHFAVVDGPLSVGCYLDTCKAAFLEYRNRAKKQGLINDGECLTDKTDRILLHLPFNKMGEKASAELFNHERRGKSVWQDITNEIGQEPSKEDYKASKLFMKKLKKTQQFRNFFDEKLKSGTIASKRTGNTYTGSLYNAFCSMLEADSQKGIDLAGKRIAFGSYGSGAIFKAFTGVIQPDYKEVVLNLDLLKQLDQREKNKKGSLSLKNYERLHEKKMGIEESVIEPENEFILARIGDTPLDRGYRYYEFAG